MKDLLENIEKPIQNKIMGLLNNRYAGSKAFRINHPDAKYCSNCNGAVEYVYSLKELNHPRSLNAFDLEKYVKTDFEISNEFVPGELVVCYKTPAKSNSTQIKNQDDVILHSGIMLGGDRLFNQSGFGGIFETKKFDEVKNKYLDLFGSNELTGKVYWASYKLKD